MKMNENGLVARARARFEVGLSGLRRRTLAARVLSGAMMADFDAAWGLGGASRANGVAGWAAPGYMDTSARAKQGYVNRIIDRPNYYNILLV